MDTSDVKQRALGLLRKVTDLRSALRTQVLGQDQVIDNLLVAVLSGGHVLLEGLPGLGKTLLVRALGQGVGLQMSRIQFTPDLMPSDVTGTVVLDGSDGQRSFRFQPGPIFAGLVLADEINRATPKTQSALLEAMQEGSVTVSGHSHRLPEPFLVIATQNPIELEGTYPLPEAQLDRFFFKLGVLTPSFESMVEILAGTTGGTREPMTTMLQVEELRQLQALVRQVLCGTHLVRLVAGIVQSTHPDNSISSEATKKYVRYGASARAGQSILLGAKSRALMAGRAAVTTEDIEACLLPALRHRVVLSYEAEAASITALDLLPEWKSAGERRSRE